MIRRVSTGVDLIGLVRHEPFRENRIQIRGSVTIGNARASMGYEWDSAIIFFLRTLRRPRPDEEAIIGLREKFKR